MTRTYAFVVLLLGAVACGGENNTTPTVPSTSTTSQDPVKLVNVDPIYPAAAQAEKVQGVVILQALIGTDGHVHNVTVLRSVDPRLDQAATDAVTQWIYSPALRNGQPVAVTVTVTVNFALR